ncbi:hypothetical protein PHYPSEUDO_002896 [Phytophthora pseudosyringae]|uniref:Uncharacterized protein n=1 Tax=Phytophthora pseudosyringae TaxID=221518 RepID=A0A8T1VVF7_9STRA|nr:hypothetical protein PHYPSEUDO_002896 [Phytophthora pseudosyringae]
MAEPSRTSAQSAVGNLRPLGVHAPPTTRYALQLQAPNRSTLGALVAASTLPFGDSHRHDRARPLRSPSGARASRASEIGETAGGGIQSPSAKRRDASGEAHAFNSLTCELKPPR